MPYKYVKNYVTRARYIAANSRRTASRSGRAAMVARFRNMKRYTVPKVLYRPKGNMSLRLPFPTKKTVTLRYVDNDTISLAPSTGKNVISSLSLLANSCYDPYAPLGGHQPMGFDQWCQLYHYFTVVGGSMKCRPIYASNVATVPVYYAVHAQDTDPIGTSVDVRTFLTSCPGKNPGQVWSKYGIHRGVTEIEKEDRWRGVKWTAGGILGIKQSDVLDRTTLQGSASSSPTDIIFGEVIVQDCYSSASSGLPFLVVMEFDVVFAGPKDLTMS